jgi:hypothetical protein
MMGPVEEAGKVATGFMDILRGQPLSLALVVMNMSLMVLVFYTANAEKASRRYMAEIILKQQGEAQSLLSKCIDIDGLKRFLDAQKQ